MRKRRTSADQKEQVFEQIIENYERFEAGPSDTWNPLKSDSELAYRLSVFACLTVALRRCEIPMASLRVLDIGCGNGRSTRMYIDLGLAPEQLAGVDVREGAISLAARLNPAIQFKVLGTEKALSACIGGQYSWTQTTTVFSSIKSVYERAMLAKEICHLLSAGGYHFYYDLVKANNFAGGDLIKPVELFDQLEPLLHCSFDENRYSTLIPSNCRYRYGGIGETIRSIMKKVRRTTRRKVTYPDLSKKEFVLFRKSRC